MVREPRAGGLVEPGVVMGRPRAERALPTARSGPRLVLLLGLGTLIFLSWAYIAHLAAGMDDMARMADMSSAVVRPAASRWSAVDFGLLTIMWIVMMIAMMLPSATPMIVMFSGTQQRRREQGRPAVATTVFVLGYLLVWSGFSVLAAALQWGLHRASLLSPMMVSVSPALGGGLLIAAGIFQWTALKDACLTVCRSPLSFMTTRWREGVGGALRMGLEHGLWCAGCCWLLMALLFVAGVMNLLWVAALSAVVLVEKLAPAGRIVSRAAGAVLVIWGSALLVVSIGG